MQLRFFLLFIAFWLFVIYLSDPFSSPSIAPPPGPLFSQFDGRPTYCSAPATGEEGRLANSANGTPPRTLRAVAIVIRHGDRSAIHPILNSTGEQPSWRCTPASHEGEGAARREWSALRSSFVVRQCGSDESAPPLPRALRSATLDDGTTCEPGQLTPKGFEQHVRLGKHLANAYTPLLDELSSISARNGSSPDRSRRQFKFLYARSTDYERTLLSAAGLLIGLLKLQPELRATPMRPLALHVEEDEANDIMHGVGLASSKPSLASKNGGAGAETTREGRCPAATRYARQQLSKWKPEPAMWARLIQLFGTASMAKLLSTGIADALFARSCHDLQPPCALAGCVDASLQRAVWRDADTFYCKRYAGSEGGLNAARLSMLPLLVEITKRLEAAVASLSSSSSASADDGKDGAARLLLYSGHDTVVAPLLAALGGLRAPNACRWPPYASHLVFEIWEEGSNGGSHHHNHHREHHSVRVLFNGRVVTSYLSGCDRHPGAEYCSLANFAKAVEGLAAEFTYKCGLSAVPT